MSIRIFVSSVQKELAGERQAVKAFILGDPLLRRFFDDVFLFEDTPARDRRPDNIYLEELANRGIYLALFGNEYGWKNTDGKSPTELEFDHATKTGRERLIFVKGARKGYKGQYASPRTRQAICRNRDIMGTSRVLFVMRPAGTSYVNDSLRAGCNMLCAGHSPFEMETFRSSGGDKAPLVSEYGMGAITARNGLCIGIAFCDSLGGIIVRSQIATLKKNTPVPICHDGRGRGSGATDLIYRLLALYLQP